MPKKTKFLHSFCHRNKSPSQQKKTLSTSPSVPVCYSLTSAPYFYGKIWISLSFKNSAMHAILKNSGFLFTLNKSSGSDWGLSNIGIQRFSETCIFIMHMEYTMWPKGFRSGGLRFWWYGPYPLLIYLIYVTVLFILDSNTWQHCQRSYDPSTYACFDLSLNWTHIATLSTIIRYFSFALLPRSGCHCSAPH